MLTRHYFRIPFDLLEDASFDFRGEDDGHLENFQRLEDGRDYKPGSDSDPTLHDSLPGMGRLC